MTTPDDQMLDDALRLAWGLWSELGVSSWAGSHRDWCVEVEPLIAFTATIAEADRRLLRETVSWCVSNEALLSMHQLRHLLRAADWPAEAALARYATTVSRRSSRSWPVAESEAPYDLAEGSRSALEDLGAPARLQLRLRTMFGVSARAEIIRVLVTRPGPAPVSEFVRRVAYTRRQITNDLEALTLSGLARRFDGPGGASFAVRRRGALLEVVGAVPRVAPPWGEWFRLLVELLALSGELRSGELSEPTTHVVRRLRPLRPLFDGLLLDVPDLRGDPDGAEVLLAWARELFRSLAEGEDVHLAPSESHR